MKIFGKLLLASLVLALSACAPITISKVEPGTQTVHEKLQVTPDRAWNKVTLANGNPALSEWTMDGLSLDSLMFFTGVKHDQPVHHPLFNNKQKDVFNFRSDMKPDQVVALFEGYLSRDGSVFQLKKLEPAQFGGEKGFRFEYSLIKKSTNVELSGIAVFSVVKGELYGMMYHAPKLGFFPRHERRVAKMMAEAKIPAK